MPLKTLFLLSYIFKNEKLLALFWNISRNSWEKLKTQANSAKIPKKLKNRQLQLSWVGEKLSKKSRGINRQFANISVHTKIPFKSNKCFLLFFYSKNSCLSLDSTKTTTVELVCVISHRRSSETDIKGLDWTNVFFAFSGQCPCNESKKIFWGRRGWSNQKAQQRPTTSRHPGDKDKVFK